MLAIQLTAAPAVLALDEPTRGLDYQAKAGLTGALAMLAGQGHSIVVATHDVEFATRTCDRVIVMAEGEIVTDGPAADRGSPRRRRSPPRSPRSWPRCRT